MSIVISRVLMVPKTWLRFTRFSFFHTYPLAALAALVVRKLTKNTPQSTNILFTLLNDKTQCNLSAEWETVHHSSRSGQASSILYVGLTQLQRHPTLNLTDSVTMFTAKVMHPLSCAVLWYNRCGCINKITICIYIQFKINTFKKQLKLNFPFQNVQALPL